MSIKLTTNKALQSRLAAMRAAEMLGQLADAERFAPVNVHSHGEAIKQSIAELESALFLACQFLNTVQGR